MLKALAKLRIRDHFPELIPATCESSVSVNEALEVMVSKKIGSLVITENSKVVSILTERDYFTKVACRDFNGQSPVSSIMTPNPMLIDADRPVDHLFRSLNYNRFHYVLVVENDQSPYTIVSMRDLIKLVCRLDL